MAIGTVTVAVVAAPVGIAVVEREDQLETRLTQVVQGLAGRERMYRLVLMVPVYFPKAARG